MITKDLKSQLQRGDTVFASWIQIGHPTIAEILVRAGFKCLVLDCEHGLIDLETAAAIMRAMGSGSCTPLVRLPKNDSTWIARIMDSGAGGIIVPMVNSAEQAAAAVAAIKYPPEGRRGIGYCRANTYGADFPQYFDAANESSVVIVQIEHADGVENIDSILDVNGVDGVFVGPYDLSGSMDVLGELDHPKMRAALQRINQSCRNHHLPAGLHVVAPEPERVKNAIEQGFRFIALSIDSVLLTHSARELLEKARKLDSA